MPLWVFLLIAAICAAIILGPWARRTAKAWAYNWRDAKHVQDEAEAEFGPPDTAFRGSMSYYDEHPERLNPGHFPPPAEWNRANAATGADWDHRTAFYNGHTIGCLVPDIDHLGACPEEGDWPDGRWPDDPDLPALQDMLPAPPGPGPDVMDAVPALEAEDQAGAGWTDQLLAELREAPTSLDQLACSDAPEESCSDAGCPVHGLDEWDAFPTVLDDRWEQRDEAEDLAWASGEQRDEAELWAWASNERLADTGEINLAGLRAQYAADLKAQAAEHEAYMASREREAARQLVDGLS